MSYGSCPSSERCVTAPNSDDINGINSLYHYDTSHGGGGCLAPDLSNQTVDAADQTAQAVLDGGTDYLMMSVPLAQSGYDTTGVGVPEPYNAVNGTAGKGLWLPTTAGEVTGPC